MLPPHFDQASLLTFLDTVGGWEVMMPAYESYPSAYKALLPRMYASVVHYHRTGWLEANVSPGHPFFFSPAYTLLKSRGSALQMNAAWLRNHNDSTELQVPPLPPAPDSSPGTGWSANGCVRVHVCACERLRERACVKSQGALPRADGRASCSWDLSWNRSGLKSQTRT